MSKCCGNNIVAFINNDDSTGVPGPSGPPNTLTIGSVTVGENDTDAGATITGDSPYQTLNLKIPKGAEGEKGDDGLSAYEVAVENGFEGNEAEWLATLNGTNGSNGSNGTGISSVSIKYVQSSDGETPPPDEADWTTEIPEVSTSNFLWVRTIVTLTNDSSYTQYSVSKMGEVGPRGNSITMDVEVTSEDGEDGDLFIVQPGEANEYNLYKKSEGEWSLKGNIKGVDGQDSPDADIQFMSNITEISLDSSKIYSGESLAPLEAAEFTFVDSGSVVGATFLIIHQAAAEPTFPENFKKMSTSSAYVETSAVNYIKGEYLDLGSDIVHYYIYQVTEST